MNVFLVSIRNLIIMTILLGGLYPAVVTVVGRAFFPIRSQGSMIQENGRYQGSELIAQNFKQDKYFWTRPAGVSNKSATSKDLKNNFFKLKTEIGEKAPLDLLYSSGSGVDPHISPEAVHFQKARIMKARNISEEQMDKLIGQVTEERFLGFMGQPRVNVFKLNKLLDKNTGK